jgi:hypothetical protein
MKTLIIFAILLLPSVVWGQITNHFVNLDSKWYVAKTYPNANQENPDFVQTTTTVFGFQGDTIINSEQWLKLYSTNDSLFQNDLLYLGSLREENNKVFYLDTLDQLDTLYDFNLNVGDSVLFDLNASGLEWLEIIDVANIQINGASYERLKFAEPTMGGFSDLNEIWIEGIGSIHGPIFPNNPRRFSHEIPDSMLVTCSFSDSQYVWQHTSYENCYVNIVLGIDQPLMFDFKVYPNPFSDIIHFENSGLGTYEVTILNEIGQIVSQRKSDSKNETFDLSALKAGIYFMRISNAKHAKTMKILVKH